jgi:hypothetical protein
MLASFEPIGIDNDKWIQELAKKAGIIIAAWGTYGNYLNRDRQVKDIIENIKCLETTKHGHPKHPLYIKADTIPVAMNV